MNTVILDGSKLKEIASRTPTAEVIAANLAIRERLRHFSDIRRTKMQLIQSGERIVDSDYMKFWKDLEEAGVGSIIHGRKNNPTKFEWYYSLKTVAKAALEGKDVQTRRLIVKDEPKVSVAELSKPTKKFENKPKLIEPRKEKNLLIIVRDDFQLEIKLPSDFNQRDAEVIGNALKRIGA